MAEKKTYDFFISYRRANNGVVCCRYIADLLKGYNVFYDINSITEGRFDSQICNALQNSERFILIVTEGAFSRPEVIGKCDWYYEEIKLAIKHIGLDKMTPIIFPGISFNEKILPTSLKGTNLCKCETIKYVHEFSNYFPNKFYKHFGIANERNVIYTSAPTFSQVYDDKEITNTDFIRHNLSFNIRGIPFNMIFVPGGSFLMGAQKNDKNAPNYNPVVLESDGPVHNVVLNDYYIGETQVSQGLWEAVMGTNPSPAHLGFGINFPVSNVSWFEIVNAFLPQLNKITHKYFRLPTEAEWEFAARGGNNTRHYGFSGSNNIDECAWYYENSDIQIHPIATKKSNELGIYDMSGNVWEWCQDWFDTSYYAECSSSNPKGPDNGIYRVVRGGSWSMHDWMCSVSFRGGREPYIGSDNGLRLALSSL